MTRSGYESDVKMEDCVIGDCWVDVLCQHSD